MTQSTTAVSNTLPGGAAIGIGMTYSMMGKWGLVLGGPRPRVRGGIVVEPWP